MGPAEASADVAPLLPVATKEAHEGAAEGRYGRFYDQLVCGERASDLLLDISNSLPDFEQAALRWLEGSPDRVTEITTTDVISRERVCGRLVEGRRDANSKGGKGASPK
jgi:hypothetical protein